MDVVVAPPDTKWTSNIALFTSKRLGKKLANRFYIIGSYNTEDFAEELGPLLDTTYVHQSLDNQLLNRMRHVLEEFADKFSNIWYLHLAITAPPPKALHGSLSTNYLKLSIYEFKVWIYTWNFPWILNIIHQS